MYTQEAAHPYLLFNPVIIDPIGSVNGSLFNPCVIPLNTHKTKPLMDFLYFLTKEARYANTTRIATV